MNSLRDKETGATLGSISDQQLQILIEQLEEESAGDTNYYINRTTLEVFAEQGIDPALLALLQRALGEREEMEIEWSSS